MITYFRWKYQLSKNLKNTKLETLYKLWNSKRYPSGAWHPPKAYGVTGHCIKTDKFNNQTISYKTSYQYVETEYPIPKAKNWIPPTEDPKTSYFERYSYH